MELVMDLENYKPKHQNRVYYPNSCNYCFQILTKLLKCGSCLAVSYCSKQHQLKDWSFHKPTCVAFNAIRSQVKPPEVLNSESFFNYRMNLLDEMAKYRNLEGAEKLTEYERQICTLPWVCAVCFNSNTKVECDVCDSITYCSAEHQKRDEKYHKRNCRDLQMCRIFSSLGYENGYQLERLVPLVYKPIREGVKLWPKDMRSLSKLIQDEIRIINTPDTYINMRLFVEPYIPAALIIYALDVVGYIKKRKLISNSYSQSVEAQQTSSTANRNSGPSTRKFTMTVHFAIADDNELNFQWCKIARMLKDWITNIYKVRFVITGPMLKESTVELFENTDESVEVFVHQKAYHEVDNLPAPDVIVLLECNRCFSCMNETKFEDAKNINALFKYSNVPVIFCDGLSFPLSKISESLSSFPDIKCLIGTALTDFTEKKMYRIWKEHMTTYTKNRLYSVFAKI